MPRPGAERSVLAALTIVLVAVVLSNDWGVLTPDTKPEIFLAPWETGSRFAASWLDTPNLGAPNYNVGVAPVAWVQGVVQALVHEPWLAMRVWRAALLLVAGWGAHRLYRTLAEGSAHDVAAGRVVAAVAYVANPYVVVGGGTTPTLLPYALLPWLAVALLRGSHDRSWRWPAAAALALAAMSGLNAGVVAILHLLIVVPALVHAVVVRRARFRDQVWLLLRTAVFFALVSAYWLLPAVAALSVGSAVAETTETLDAINIAGSFPEVLRGLGFWPLYGGDVEGPFLPGYQSYLLAPAVVVLTFGWPVVATAGARVRHPLRLFAATSLAVGAVVMVGAFPWSDQTLWGRFVVRVLEDVPGAIAFRTTNKAGALTLLGVSLLAGLAAAGAAGRLAARHPRPGGRSGAGRGLRTRLVVAAAVVVGTAAAGVAPAWSGDLYAVRMPVPAYWEDAADAVNGHQGPGRVLMVPGVDLSRYTWGYEGPDELGPSLFTRPFVVRSTTPSGSPYAAELLGGLDQRLRQGDVADGVVSALARHVGATDVVGRYDLTDIGDAGRVVDDVLAGDPGLVTTGTFGPADPDRGTASSVRTTRVAAAPGVGGVGVRIAGGTLLVDGSGSSLADVASAGLDAGTTATVLAGSLPDATLERTLRAGARVVLTDSNRRQEWSSQRAEAVGPLVAAEVDPGASRVLFGPPEQTVAETRGNATVSATGPGLLFGPQPTSDPTLAFDGDRTTAWRFGNFATGVGNALVVRLSSPQDIGVLTVQPANDGGNAITEIKVTAKGAGPERSVVAPVGPWSSYPTSVDLGGTTAREVVIEVTAATSPGIGPLGIAEVGLPGVQVARTARLPERLTETLAAWTGDQRAVLDDTPVDVLLHRRGAASRSTDVEEAGLARSFSLPQRRVYAVSGVVQLASGAPDDVVDDLLGDDGAVRATSTSRAFANPALRASTALDGTTDQPDLTTGWVPADPVVGESIVVDVPNRDLTSFTVTQPADGAHATRALVSVDDGRPFEVALGPGPRTVTLPEPRRVSRVRVLLTATEGVGLVRVLDIGLPRVAGPASRAPDGCLTVATLDGRDLRVSLRGSRADLAAGRPVPFELCGPDRRLALGSGRHRVEPVRDFAVDDLRFRDEQNTVGNAPLPSTVVERGATGARVRLDAPCEACWVSSGQGFDARWQASVGGRDLGRPVVVDGYASGWWVDGAAGDVVTMSYAAVPVSRAAWGVSAVAFLACVALALRHRWAPVVRRRLRARRGGPT